MWVLFVLLTLPPPSNGQDPSLAFYETRTQVGCSLLGNAVAAKATASGMRAYWQCVRSDKGDDP